MDISEFTIEDFIYDATFRQWVLQPIDHSEKYWARLLAEYPFQAENIKQARTILLRMEAAEYDLHTAEFEQIWSQIDNVTRPPTSHRAVNQAIPLHQSISDDTLRANKYEYHPNSQFIRIAAIIIVSICLGTLAASLNKTTVDRQEPLPVVYEEHHAPRGVKSFLTLSDGSSVILNSGSSIKYVKGFEKDKREVTLEGEAFFDVFEDASRPFIVKKDDVHIKALGTSFNVEAYGTEDLKISLVSGRVAIDLPKGEHATVILEKGESLQVKPGAGTWNKALFNEDEVLAWTKKIIIFNKTPVLQAVRVLENWYSIDFHLENKPIPGLLISGRFENETLENVLLGLGYTTHLRFEMKDDVVNIEF